MRNDFLTWEDLDNPSNHLRCAIENLVCGLDCYKPVVSIAKAPGGFISFTGPLGTIVFKEGGISVDANNSIVAGSDGLPFFKEKITDINSISIVGSDLTISYTNETAVLQTKAIPLSSICTACATASISPASFISADLLNEIELGTDGKLYASFSPTTNVPVTNAFTVNVGSSVTLTHIPLTNYHVQVFRNGMRQRITQDYSVVGTTVTFVTAFGNSGNGSGNEEILVDYYRN
jgi:hypothetical protein